MSRRIICNLKALCVVYFHAPLHPCLNRYQIEKQAWLEKREPDSNKQVKIKRSSPLSKTIGHLPHGGTCSLIPKSKPKPSLSLSPQHLTCVRIFCMYMPVSCDGYIVGSSPFMSCRVFLHLLFHTGTGQCDCGKIYGSWAYALDFVVSSTLWRGLLLPQVRYALVASSSVINHIPHLLSVELLLHVSNSGFHVMIIENFRVPVLH